ncbi:MAG: FecR family protein [Defluviitaleaceae bacterium]|nr:FecR family protein [Defluviitaleaceae bacterium]
MKRKITAWFLAFALCFGAVPVYASDTATSRTFVIESINGNNATLTRGTAREFRASRGTRLAAGNTVTTGRDTELDILMDNNSIVTMDSFTKIDISKLNRNDLKLTVITGSIAINAAQRNEGNSTQVKSGNSIMGIRGTLFTVVNRNGVTRTVLLEGSLDVSTPDGDFNMEAGYILVVDGNITAASEESVSVFPLDIGLIPDSFTLEYIQENAPMLLEIGTVTEDDVQQLDALIYAAKAEEAKQAEAIQQALLAQQDIINNAQQTTIYPDSGTPSPSPTPATPAPPATAPDPTPTPTPDHTPPSAPDPTPTPTQPPPPTTFTVTFVDWNGTVLKTETVNNGGNATPPANPTRPNHTFTGWSGAYTGVTSNRTITAQYTPTGTPDITITTQPTNTPVTAGNITQSLSVAASVTMGATLSYQWYSNTSASNTGGTAIGGATGASFAIPTGLTQGAYYYFVEVSATGGATSVRSNPATVTVSASGASNSGTFNIETGTWVGTPPEAQYYTWADPILTVNDDADITITGTVSNGRRIVVAANAEASITLNNVSITGLGSSQSPLLLNNGANLTLLLLNSNHLTGGSGAAGLGALVNAALIIDGTGQLTVQGDTAGIGNGGGITIRGSVTVHATGGSGNAGIGGRWGGNGGTITITDNANVTAVGGDEAAGIGGGNGVNTTNRVGHGGVITISGNANVTATSTGAGAGIGGGRYSAGGSITITDNAVVNASGTAGGAGIGGGGDGGNSGTIIINGSANITAASNWGGAAIGGGGRPSYGSGTVTISGTPIIHTYIGANGVPWGIGPGDSSMNASVNITGGTFTGGAISINWVNHWAVTFNLASGTRTGGGELFQLVENGTNATAPIVTPPAGQEPANPAWSPALSPITGHTPITAQWTAGGGNTATVTGGAFTNQGFPTLAAALDTIGTTAGTYNITLYENQNIGARTLENGLNITLSANSAQAVQLTGTGSLFTILAANSLTLGDNITLRGVNNNIFPLVVVEGTFTMNGGTITGNTTTGSGGGVRVADGAVFNMSGGTITGNTAAANGGGVIVQKIGATGGTFNLTGNGTITNNNAQWGGGLAVFGEFSMNGGTISGNTATDNGGGIIVYGDASLSGGTISGNNARWGGGVCVDEANGIAGTVTMGGVAMISNNTAVNLGNGVYMRSGTFIMNNGSINGNNGNNGGGGGASVDGGVFTMNGGTISNNTFTGSGSGGGGVNVQTNGVFTMNNGTISGNSAANGGGVSAGTANGTFNMNGGVISGNTGTTAGGGVYVSASGGIFTMTGGVIAGTDATGTDGNPNIAPSSSGAALFVASGGTGTARYGPASDTTNRQNFINTVDLTIEVNGGALIRPTP